ncbi:MAG: glycosyltransferase, partial [Elusimicrobia bacterium]|nr:glycosyltransferase [Elusimicrobiota bacterium]
LGVRLKVVGIGSEEARRRRLAQGADVEFLGWQSAEALRELYRGCAALLFSQDEDFGISAVEAMACGRPVIAYKKGGALETVREGVTGVFFDKQTPAALAQAMEQARGIAFDPAKIRAHALQFDGKHFKDRLARFVQDAWRAAGAARKIKVFEVLECGSPHGVGHQVATLSRFIDHARFETWVVYAVRPGFTPAEFERMTGSADRHVHIPEMVRPISPLDDLAALWKLYRLFRRERPDVVHAASSKAGVLGRLAAWLAGVPRIYFSPHGYSFLQTDAGPLLQKLYWGIEKSVSWIGSIIACSDGEQALARRLSWGREVFQVRNLFVMEPPPPRSRDQDGLVLVGAVGRLTPARNPEAFLRLAERVTREHPQARFVWLGGGELEEEIRGEAARRRLGDRLELAGHLPRERLLQRFADLDVFVHYSRWEGGAPIALHEAMALSLPVVASKIAGNVDLVVHGVTGFLAGGEEDLFRQVSRLVSSPGLRAELGRQGKARLDEVASLDKSVEALERLYAA